MTDKTRQDSGSTHIIRYALEMGLLWIDGDGRDKVREALDALDMLEAQLEAVCAGGVQALSAAPAGWKLVPVEPTNDMQKAADEWAAKGFDWPKAVYRAMLAASPTPPAEQQATKETSGGFHVWRDISTAPKDGSHFVATGYNYGLYSEGRHICVAQWFRGCWMETSDWNEASELQHLTHWLPLPSPPDNAAELNDLDVSVSPQQAAPKAAPGDVLDEALLERDDAEDFIDALLDEVLGHERPEWSSSYGRADALNDVQERMTALHKPAVDKAWGRFQSAMAAPQQEAQEPCQTCTATARTVMMDQVSFDRKPDCYAIRQITDDEGVEEWEDIRTSPDVAREEANNMMATRRGEVYEVVPLWTTPQPAPAPLIARSLAEWHEDDGCVAWWAWNGREWAGEPAWIGTPNCEDWPGYHTHWTPHPEQPVCAALAAQGGK